MQTETYAPRPQPALDAPCVRFAALQVEGETSAKRRRTSSKPSKNTEKLLRAAVSGKTKNQRTVQPAAPRGTSRLKRTASPERSAGKVTSIAHADASAKQSSIEKNLPLGDPPAEPIPVLSPDRSAQPATPLQNEAAAEVAPTCQPLTTCEEDPRLAGEGHDQVKPASSCTLVEEPATAAGSSRGFITMLRFLAKSALAFVISGWSRLQQRVKSQQAKKRLRVCETVSLGEKRFIAVIQVDGEQFLVGGSSSSVSTLAHLEQPHGFPEALRRSYEGGDQA
jgi:flagellar biogenesis protein FliO